METKSRNHKIKDDYFACTGTFWRTQEQITASPRPKTDPVQEFSQTEVYIN